MSDRNNNTSHNEVSRSDFVHPVMVKLLLLNIEKAGGRKKFGGLANIFKSEDFKGVSEAQKEALRKKWQNYLYRAPILNYETTLSKFGVNPGASTVKEIQKERSNKRVASVEEQSEDKESEESDEESEESEGDDIIEEFDNLDLNLPQPSSTPTVMSSSRRSSLQTPLSAPRTTLDLNESLGSPVPSSLNKVGLKQGDGTKASPYEFLVDKKVPERNPVPGLEIFKVSNYSFENNKTGKKERLTVWRANYTSNYRDFSSHSAHYEDPNAIMFKFPTISFFQHHKQLHNPACHDNKKDSTKDEVKEEKETYDLARDNDPERGFVYFRAIIPAIYPLNNSVLAGGGASKKIPMEVLPLKEQKNENSRAVSLSWEIAEYESVDTSETHGEGEIGGFEDIMNVVS